MSRDGPLPQCFDTRLVYPYLFYHPAPIQNECSTCVFIAASEALRTRFLIDQDPTAFVWFCKWNDVEFDDAAFARTVQDHVKMSSKKTKNLFETHIVPAWDSFACSDSKRSDHSRKCIQSYQCHGDGIVPEDLLDLMKDHGCPCTIAPSFASKSLGRIAPEHITGSWKLVPKPVINSSFTDVLHARYKIKRSLLDHGPLMATIRIDRKSFYDPDRFSSYPRRAYTLPGPGVYDEYHQVLVVGFSWAPSSLHSDRLVPCWIIQDWRDVDSELHSVSEEYNTDYHPSFLHDTVAQWAKLARLVPVRGFFTTVEMTSRNNRSHDRSVNLEEHAYGFRPYDA